MTAPLAIPSRPARAAMFAAGIVLAVAAPRAQENFELGRMWTFERPPLEYLQEEYGFKPSQRWLDVVRLASLRFGGGCSASFVSPKGLILTNHHCVRGDLANNQGDADWVKNGYVARTMADERRLEGLTVQQLVEMREVTDAVNAGIGDGDDEATIAAKREKNREEILARARAEHPDLQPQVVMLFQGAVWQLYLYKTYDDVRIVMAPHLQAAHFGGDFDNFTYPRFAIDFALCRAYEDGEPADTSAHYFRMSLEGPRDGELVFVTGNPGSTERLLTKAQMEYHRDVRMPRMRQMIDNRLEAMRALAARSSADEKELRTSILRYENGQKAYRGMHEGLLDDGFMADKAAAEAAFRERVLGDARLASKYGDLWERIASVTKRRATLDPKLNFQTPGGSAHLARALAILRAVGGDEGAAQQARAMSVAMTPVQTAWFVDHLERARMWLGEDDPFVRAALGGREPAQAAAALASDSRLGDDAFVRELLAGGEAAVQKADDPALRIGRVLLPLVEANAAADATLSAREGSLGTQLGLALFDAYGTTVSPDATFTLRMGDGVVKGYDYNGTIAPWRTVFYGMFGRNVNFGNEHPFDLPQEWLDAKDRIDMTAAVNFVSTNDTTGGNSGSPVIDRDAELVGLLFDGNIESLPNDYLFKEDTQRSVSVHVDAIFQALTEVYGADRVAEELRDGR